MHKEKTAPQSVITGFALGLITISLVVYILIVSAEITVPFVMAVFLWYLINGIARGISGIRPGGVEIPRMLCFLLAILLLVGGFWEGVDIIRNNAQKVAAAAPVYQKHFQAMVPQLMAMFGLDHIPTLDEIMPHVDLGAVIKTLAGLFTGIAGKTFEVVFFTGFLLYEQRFFERKLMSMSSDRAMEEKIRHILRNIDAKIQRYIWVKAFVSALASVATYIILTIVHEDFAGFWALLAFVLHFIPYVGTLAAIALPSVVALAQFGDLGTFLVVVVSLSGALMGIGHVLDPRLLGDTMNLSPIAIIMSLAMWGMIWGVPGMFLAIPILAIIVITLSQFETTRPIAVLLSKTGIIDKTMKARK